MKTNWSADVPGKDIVLELLKASNVNDFLKEHSVSLDDLDAAERHLDYAVEDLEESAEPITGNNADFWALKGAAATMMFAAYGESRRIIENGTAYNMVYARGNQSAIGPFVEALEKLAYGGKEKMPDDVKLRLYTAAADFYDSCKADAINPNSDLVAAMGAAADRGRSRGFGKA